MTPADAGPASAVAPTALEVAAGRPLGMTPARRSPPPPPSAYADVRSAIEEVVVDHLREPHCRVSFSGGLDSSMVLAIAADTARRHGLPLPIATTVRLATPDEDEEAWQALVLDHLGIADRELVEVDAELRVIGPAAGGVIDALGHVPLPANAHAHAPIIRAGCGGSVLTGIGGDELYSGNPLWVRTRGPAGLVGDAVRAGQHLTSLARTRLRADRSRPWLTAGAVARIQSAERRSEATLLRHDSQIRQWRGTRAFASLASVLPAYGRHLGTRVCHPLMAPGVVDALEAAVGRRGFADRANIYFHLFGDLLPRRLFERTTKATFAAAFVGPEVAEFARDWDGLGLDHELVDVDRLRQVWLDPSPPAPTWALLQQAWVAAGRPEALGVSR